MIRYSSENRKLKRGFSLPKRSPGERMSPPWASASELEHPTRTAGKLTGIQAIRFLFGQLPTEVISSGKPAKIDCHESQDEKMKTLVEDVQEEPFAKPDLGPDGARVSQEPPELLQTFSLGLRRPPHFRLGEEGILHLQPEGIDQEV